MNNFIMEIGKFPLPQEFVLIVDVDGHPVDLVPVQDDVIWAVVRETDREHPGDAPHVPWHWNGSVWNLWK